MANDSKLLGVLELDSKNVQSTIEEVNNKLKSLGQGVDLNLTNILNAKVNSQLKELKQQIDEVNKAATGSSGSGKTSEIKQINALLTQQYNAQLKLTNLENRSNVSQNQVNRQQSLLNDAKMRLAAQNQEKVAQQASLANFQKMQEKIKDAQAASADRAARIQQDSAAKQKALQEKQVSDEIKANQKAANEIARQQEKLAKQKSDANKKAEQDYQKSVDAQIKAAEKAAQEQAKLAQKQEADQQAMTAKAVEQGNKWYQSQVESAAKLYKEQYAIQEKLASGTAGPQETNVLKQQLAENEQALSQYSQSIRDAAQADASVVQAQQNLAISNARAQDRILAEETKRMQQYHDQQKNYGVNLVGAASLAILKKQWTEAVNYATSYYDALNEIRIVTEMSEQNAMKMGQNMRDLAEEMKVTSTELSEAAITFYRQGLNDAEVQDRLKWVTEYAKVAHIGFEDAAELMTAAINTMGDSIEQSGIENVVEHVADVWLYLGDHAATSGEEIGKAMQKASASATEFGMSFEWLGTYIAVVSEQTRQAPEAIGNAFNSMMARMHQIKATGFNNEDTTKLNDVAKALATINVELTENGQWRAMSDIYSDIAEKWGEMDAKQRGYIATTMAGTRQQNVFYALMNDMSKGLENGSRAWELYEGAMNAAGTATEKYAIYQESIEATQADMTNSLEQLYSNLQPTLIKGFYELITLIVDGLNNLGGVLPIVSAGVAGLATAFIAFKAAAPAFTIALSAAAAVLGTLFVGGAMGALLGGGETAVEKYKKITDEIADSNKKITSLQTAEADIGTMLAKVQSGATLSTEELKKYSNSLNTISSISPTAEQGVRNLTKGFGDQATILQELSDKTQEAIAGELELRAILSEDALRNYQNADEYSQYRDITSRKNYDRAAEEWGSEYGIVRWAQEAGGTLGTYLQQKILDGAFDFDDTSELEAAVENYFAAYEKVISDVTKKEAVRASGKIIESLGQAVNNSQKQYLQEAIINQMMGDDGTLDYEDVAYKRIQEIWTELQQGAEEAFSNTSQYKNWLLDNLSEYFGISAEDISESLIMESDGKIEEATIEIIEQMYDLATAGGDVDAIFEALSTSSSWDEFTKKLDGVKKSVQETNKALDEGGGGEDEDPLKNIKTAYTEIDKIQSLLDKMKDGKPVKLKDLIEMAESHPEILAVADSLGKLKAKLEEIQELSKGDIKTALTDMILGTNLEDSSFSPLNQEASRIQAENGVKTVGEYRNYLAGQEGTEGVVANIDATIASQVDGLISASEETTELTDDFSDFLKQVNNLNNAKDALKVFQDLANGELVETSKIENAAKVLKELFPDKNLDPSSATFIKDVTAAIAEIETEAQAAGEAYGEMGQTILNSSSEAIEAAKKLAEEEKKAAEEAAKRLEGYRDLIREIQNAQKNTKSSKVNYGDELTNFRNILGEKGAKGVVSAWESLGKNNKELQTAIKDRYPKFAQAVANAALAEGDLTQETEDLKTALDESIDSAEKMTKLDEAKYFKNTSKAVKELIQGGEDYTEALAAFNKEQETAIAAQEEFTKINEQVGGVSQATTDDVKNLSEALGWDAQSLLDNWGQVGPLLEALGADMESIRAQLQQEILMKIIGSSDADFSNIMNGLTAVEDEASSAVQALLATGQFEIEEKELNEEMTYKLLDAAGNIINLPANSTGKAKFIVPKGGGISTKGSGGGSKGGGGGGGGGGSKETKPISESTRALDRMSKIQDLQNHTQSLYSAQAGYYEQTGEIDLAIKYHQKEIEVIQRKNATLEDNIEELEDLIEKKREEVSSLDKSSEEYETAAKELEDLQKRHQEYTLAVIENKTQIDSLNEAIKNLKKEVRDMQIELYDEVVAALEARDEAEKERLEGTINVQNAILDVMEEQDDALSKQHDMENARVSLEQELLSTMEDQEEVANRMLDGRIAMENNVLSILEAQDEKKKNQEEKEKGILDASVQLENEILNTIQQQEATKQSMREGQISMENTILGIMKDQKSTADAMLDSRISVENLVLETLKMQEDIQNRLLEGRISMESTILGILQQQEKANLQILDGRIGVENSILNILKQQDSLTSQMLSSRIGMENTILNIIKAQVAAEKSQVSAVVNVENAVASMIKAQIDAEKNMMKARSTMEGILTGFIKTDIQERANAAAEAAEAANEANQKQIEALRAQKDLLDEQLRLRKEAAQTQDKQAKLAELEAQYARISADPTRMKEALKIRKQIDELRDEMAWDIAEKEVEAQKKAIDKKIEALSAKQTPTGGTVTYDMQEINTTVEGILDTMSDEEIINWLKEHSADYKDASKIGKELLVQEWQDALDEMHGVSESYLDEVSDVLKMSDDEILAWFKDNSEEYQQASDARKSQMEDEWKEMLANMHGETETYVEQVAELLDKPREEILQWLMENDKNYLNASEDSKTKMVNDWNDALDKMYGVTKSYQDRVTELIGMSREELLEWFKENDQNYLNASEDSQEKMVNDWNSALDKMYGVTKDYREEIASIMKMSRDELLGWLMESDSNYLMATEDNQQKMVKSWNDTLDKMFGTTDNYRAQVSAIMSMDDEGILSWLMGNNTNYLNATSDSSKTKLEKEWRDMLSNMHGETESYVEAVALVLEGSRSEIIDWLISNDASYMIASEEQKNQMLDDWNDALDKMYGVTKDYRDQVSYVMSMDEEGILGWLMTNNDSYLRASDASQRQMVQQWKDTLSNMHDDTKSYVQAVADILGQPREEILKWMIENDTEYEKASDAQRSKMVKDWESALDDMYGTTTNHWTKITEIMNGGLEVFLEYMETNSTSYANMSETEKNSTVKEWTDTWREMVDETVDHREEVKVVMEQGYDYFISYMKENSEAYKTATDEAKQSMVDSWKDMWDQMEGTTKSYEEEANSIIAAGQDAILKTLGTYVKDYQKYGKLQSEAYLDEWEDKIEKLKKALKVVGDIEDKSYDYTVTDLKADAPTGTKDSGSSGSKSGEDSGVKWWRVSVNKSRGFETKAEAEAFKSERIASIQAELAKNPSDKDLQNRLNTWNNASISYYLHGGMVNKTGPIWVDGTPELPERILSPRQTELFEILVESMDEMSKMYVPSIPSFGNVMTDNRNGSFSFGDIIVNVEHLDSDTDYDEMAEHVLDSVMGKINRSSVVGGIRFSK